MDTWTEENISSLLIAIYKIMMRHTNAAEEIHIQKWDFIILIRQSNIEKRGCCMHCNYIKISNLT